MNKKLKERVFNKCDGHCAYCGKQLTIKTMQVDHFHPKLHADLCPIPIDDYCNLLPACRSCNFYKNAMNLRMFRKRVFTVMERLRKSFIYRVAIDYGFVVETENNGDERFYFERNRKQGHIYPDDIKSAYQDL